MRRRRALFAVGLCGVAIVAIVVLAVVLSENVVYFRTVTTDAFQGPNMANYYAEKLKVKSVYVLDDGGAYGVGIADSFQKRAQEKGIKVMGRDQLNPKEADYTTILTKIKGLNPDAIYYGGVDQAGIGDAGLGILVSTGDDSIPDVVSVNEPGRRRLFNQSVREIGSVE